LTLVPVLPDLAALASAIGGPPVTRFAPSPTGYLHLGHVVNAIYVWGVARALGGRVLLRMEDHDRIRCRREYEVALIEDLAWLGFEPDDGLNPLLRQSDTPAVYQRALDGLRRTHHVYVCECSRKAIGAERYDNRCRVRELEDLGGRGLRVTVGPETESFVDALLGALVQAPAEQCGDLLVRDRDGQWTYQFAVTVDDFRQGINLVIRGTDLVPSTGRQLALARMLGRFTAPVFLHHPLIRDARGEKLSKSASDTSVRELRAAGVNAPEVIGSAAALAGLISERRALPASEVCTVFKP